MRLYSCLAERTPCAARAATQVESIRTQQNTAPLRYPEFGLNKRNFEDVRKHNKRLC